MMDLPDYNKITFPENPPIPFEEIVPDATEDALDLLGKFLVYPTEKVYITHSGAPRRRGTNPATFKNV